MALNAPRYFMEGVKRKGRWERLWAMLQVNGSLKMSNGWVVAFLALGLMVTVLPFVIIVALDPFGIDVKTFYGPFGGHFLFLFAMLVTAMVGGGVISDDFATKSISLYLSRPITLLDYLIGKFSTVAALLGVLVLLPGVIAVIVAGSLGYISASVTLQSIFTYLGAAILMVIVFASIALFLSSFTTRRTWASSGIFGVLLFTEIVSNVLAEASSDPNWIYLSPWEDFDAVARAMFGITGTTNSSFFGAPLPAYSEFGYIAFLCLLGLTVTLLSLTYIKLTRTEVGTE